MINKSKFVFFGTPEFGKVVLEKVLNAGWRPSLVVCNPDKPVGRKQIITPPPVKVLAESQSLKIVQPEKVLEIEAKLKELEPDFAIVAAYGKIIPNKILSIPKLGVIGVHPSLLPKRRGASPIQTTLLNGDQITGVTLFLVDNQVDHGPIIAQEKYKIDYANINYERLEKILAEMGGNLLSSNLPDFILGKIKPITQNESEATFTKKFVTEDGRVDLKNDSLEIIYRKILALNPEPGVFSFMEIDGKEKRVKLLEAKLENNSLLLTKIQPEGQKPRQTKLKIRENVL